jgi:hypothetical protein
MQKTKSKMVQMFCVILWIITVLPTTHQQLRIPESSSSGWLEIDETKTTYITCSGFNSNETVLWTLSSNNSQPSIVATCYSGLSSCNISSGFGSSLYANRTEGSNKSYSQLYFDDNQRTMAGNGTVQCFPQNPTPGSIASCRTNVYCKYQS